MQEMIFKTVGILPPARGSWHIRSGGGHTWFVSEDPDVMPRVMLDGVLTPVVDAAAEPSAPLIMPLVDA